MGFIEICMETRTTASISSIPSEHHGANQLSLCNCAVGEILYN